MRLTDRDPLAGSAWSDARTVKGFVDSPSNASLMAVAAEAFRSDRARRDGRGHPP
jgi:hypothetical protein